MFIIIKTVKLNLLNLTTPDKAYLKVIAFWQKKATRAICTVWQFRLIHQSS